MDAIKNCINTVILSGNYNPDELVNKIETLWIGGKLTDEERSTLIDAAYEHARDVNQVESAILNRVSGLEQTVYALENRIYALEHAGDEEPEPEPEPEPAPAYHVYEPGYVTAKGETVLFDYDGDGEYDLLRYDGGKASTTLSPGKISGWHVVDAEGNILGDYYKGNFTPVSNEPEGEEVVNPDEPHETEEEPEETEPGEGE